LWMMMALLVERGLYAMKLLRRQNCFVEFGLRDPAP
jgi:hypothetical protein